MNNQSFYLGVVEDRDDPLMLGRVRVRILGLHTHDKSLLPTADLPWAYKIQQTTSGAISGIGHAPVGVMEGTWVAVQFIDPDQQMPFVVGTLGGIPPTSVPPLESFELINGTANVTATDGTPVTSGDGTPVTTEKEALAATESSINVRSVREFSPSEEIIEKLKKSERFVAKPYKDTEGIWTIGYGNTYLANGEPVTENTPALSAEQAEALMRLKLETEFVPSVKRNVRVPVTQSMFDSMVHMAYNVGIGGFSTFTRTSGLNSGSYEQAAEFMLTFRINLGSSGERGLRNRRRFESNWFLREGVPQKDGTVKETPQSSTVTVADPANQNSTTGYLRRNFNGTLGFKDPNDKYPLATHVGEPDTNRLARNQRIRDTVVYTKELAEHKGIEKANGKGTWDQSPTPYNAKYPFNNVWQSESGHILEFDDTPGAERVQIYHKSGTFTEIDLNGTHVTRVVGDGFQIYERNGYVHVEGNMDVSVKGANTVRVDDTLDLQVKGAAVINLHDNAKLNVAGDFDITAGGNIKMSAGGVVHMHASSNIALDGSRIDFNSGVASPMGKIAKIGGDPVEFPALDVPSRKTEDAQMYETPDDGSEAQFLAHKQNRIANGTATKEDLETKPTTTDSKKPPENTVKETPVTNDIAPGTTTFDYNKKISKYFTLADLTASGSRKLRAQAGLTADQIYFNLKALAINVLDPLKEIYPSLKINSCLRLENTASQHNKGQAVDVSFPGLSRAQLYDRILEVQKIVPYDQLILEYLTPGGNGWIHISFNAAGNRRSHFTMNNHTRISQFGTFVRVA
jgi:GH24 family phage-related lysozyme (muramidase)